MHYRMSLKGLGACFKENFGAESRLSTAPICALHSICDPERKPALLLWTMREEVIALQACQQPPCTSHFSKERGDLPPSKPQGGPEPYRRALQNTLGSEKGVEGQGIAKSHENAREIKYHLFLLSKRKPCPAQCTSPLRDFPSCPGPCIQIRLEMHANNSSSCVSTEALSFWNVNLHEGRQKDFVLFSQKTAQGKKGDWKEITSWLQVNYITDSSLANRNTLDRDTQQNKFNYP